MCKIYPGIEFDPVEEQVDTIAEKEKKNNLLMNQLCRLYASYRLRKRAFEKTPQALDNKDPVGD